APCGEDFPLRKAGNPRASLLKRLWHDISEMSAMPFIRWALAAILLAGNAGTRRADAASAEPAQARPEVIPAGDQPTDYVEVLPPSEKALSYYHSGNVLWLINTAWGIVIPCLFLFTGFSGRLRTWAQRLGRKWFFTVCVYFLILWIVVYLIDWPLNF